MKWKQRNDKESQQRIMYIANTVTFLVRLGEANRKENDFSFSSIAKGIQSHAENNRMVIKIFLRGLGSCM